MRLWAPLLGMIYFMAISGVGMGQGPRQVRYGMVLCKGTRDIGDRYYSDIIIIMDDCKRSYFMIGKR